MRKYLFLFFLIGFVTAATPVQAQTITQVRLSTYNQGAATSFQQTTIPMTSLTCGLPSGTQAPGVIHNPNRFFVPDPADATKECQYTDPGTGPLLSLPFGTQVYYVTAAFINSVGPSPESPVSSFFDHAGTVPVAPARVRIQ